MFRDEQRVIDLYADSGMLAKRFDASVAFDTSFNAAVQNGLARV
jgi:hypothetical protein